MLISFSKYQVTGNDFVIIDNREQLISADNYKLIKRLCDRKFGIGADGLMLLENQEGFDFKMVYFNSDGKEGSMCGNGGRCIVAFAHKLGIFESETKFIAVDGAHIAKVNKSANELSVSLKMQDVINIEKIGSDFFLDTGSPHYVRFIDNNKNFDTYKEGYSIRNNERFKKEGTNVNFVSFNNKNITVSTFERGVEDETLSCGTGVVASTLCSDLFENKDKTNYKIETKGGNLEVSYKKIDNQRFDNIWLSGPASFVFSGTINQ